MYLKFLKTSANIDTTLFFQEIFFIALFITLKVLNNWISTLNNASWFITTRWSTPCHALMPTVDGLVQMNTTSATRLQIRWWLSSWPQGKEIVQVPLVIEIWIDIWVANDVWFKYFRNFVTKIPDFKIGIRICFGEPQDGYLVG